MEVGRGLVESSLTTSTEPLDGLFSIQNISFYNDANLALGESGEDDWKRQGLYMGPAVSWCPLPLSPLSSDLYLPLLVR